MLIVVVTLWSGPWSPLPKITLVSAKVDGERARGQDDDRAAFDARPCVGGSAIRLRGSSSAALLARKSASCGQTNMGAIFAKTFNQTWDAFLVGIFIFGLAYLFNYSGMASSLAKGFSGLGA